MTKRNDPPVGYASPPVQHRFKKGKSGNPKGRPKKQDDLWSHMNRVLNRKVKLQGTDRQIPIREALVRRLRDLALAGDRRALELQRRILAEAGATEQADHDPNAKTREILARLRRLGVYDKKESGDA